MARKLNILLLGILCLVTNTSATDELLQLLKTRSATIYCGRNLSDVLSLVCKGKYNAPSHVHDHQKRDNNNVNMRDLEDNTPFQFPFISQASTENFMARFRRRRRHPRGVYNECCQKPCSYEVLRSYCADDR